MSEANSDPVFIKTSNNKISNTTLPNYVNVGYNDIYIPSGMYPSIRELDAKIFAQHEEKTLEKYHKTIGYKIRKFFGLKEWKFNNDIGWYK
jgi:hypothetical protein